MFLGPLAWDWPDGLEWVGSRVGVMNTESMGEGANDLSPSCRCPIISSGCRGLTRSDWQRRRPGLWGPWSYLFRPWHWQGRWNDDRGWRSSRQPGHLWRQRETRVPMASDEPGFAKRPRVAIDARPALVLGLCFVVIVAATPLGRWQALGMAALVLAAAGGFLGVDPGVWLRRGWGCPRSWRCWACWLDWVTPLVPNSG